jgi:hypothetical protein
MAKRLDGFAGGAGGLARRRATAAEAVRPAVYRDEARAMLAAGQERNRRNSLIMRFYLLPLL